MIVTSDMMTKMIVTKIMMKTMTVIAVRSLAQVAGIYFEVSAIHQNFPCDDDYDVEDDGDDDDDDVEDNDDDDDNDVEDDDDDNMLKS